MSATDRSAIEKKRQRGSKFKTTQQVSTCTNLLVTEKRCTSEKGQQSEAPEANKKNERRQEHKKTERKKRDKGKPKTKKEILSFLFFFVYFLSFHFLDSKKKYKRN